jgi:type VI secretion system protein VasD
MRSFPALTILLCTLTLAACASDNAPPKREPLKLEIAVDAHSNVNPDDRMRAAPVLVRVYELKNVDTFNDADFQSLHEKDKAVLTEDLLARDQFLLRPGEHKSINRDANGSSTALGVIAAFRDLPNSVWRTTWPLPLTPKAAWYRRAPRLKLVIDLDANAVTISDASPKSK